MTLLDPRKFHLRLPKYQGPVLPEPSWAWWPGVKDHHETASSPRTRHADGKIEAVVIHATAGGSSSGAMSVLMDDRASWHFLIPDEDEREHGVSHWDCIPEKRAAWHVSSKISHPDLLKSRRYINYWSVGIEVVNRQKLTPGQNDPFSEWQVRRTAAIVRYLWSKYPEMRNVISHAKLDPNRRTDPGSNFPWNNFAELVLKGPFPEEEDASIVVPRKGITILAPCGGIIDCEPRIDDGVGVGEIRALAEGLGFDVRYSEDRRGRVVEILERT